MITKCQVAYKVLFRTWDDKPNEFRSWIYFRWREIFGTGEIFYRLFPNEYIYNLGEWVESKDGFCAFYTLSEAKKYKSRIEKDTNICQWGKLIIAKIEVLSLFDKDKWGFKAHKMRILEEIN